jgi:hypothetical protein
MYLYKQASLEILKFDSITTLHNTLNYVVTSFTCAIKMVGIIPKTKKTKTKTKTKTKKNQKKKRVGIVQNSKHE